MMNEARMTNTLHTLTIEALRTDLARLRTMADHASDLLGDLDNLQARRESAHEAIRDPRTLAPLVSRLLKELPGVSAAFTKLAESASNALQATADAAEEELGALPPAPVHSNARPFGRSPEGRG